MVFEEFLKAMGLTQRELASAISVPISTLMNGQWTAGMSPATALRLAKYFGTSPD